MFSSDLVSHTECSTILKGPKLHFGLNDDNLLLAAMASLTIQTSSLQASGAYYSNIEAQRN